MNTHLKTSIITIKCNICKDDKLYDSVAQCAQHLFDDHENIVVSTRGSANTLCKTAFTQYVKTVSPEKVLVQTVLNRLIMDLNFIFLFLLK